MEAVAGCGVVNVSKYGVRVLGPGISCSSWIVSVGCFQRNCNKYLQLMGSIDAITVRKGYRWSR